MKGEALLVGIGTFAIGIAGFSAVAASLRQQNPGWNPTHSLRVRGIVSTSLNVAFESAIPLIAASALGDERRALLIASLIAGTYLLAVLVLRSRQAALMRGVRLRWLPLILGAGWVSDLLFFANALVFVSVGVYGLALWVQLLVPAVSFYSLISEPTNRNGS